MFSKTLAAAGLLASVAISAVNAAVPTITTSGSKFFYSNGTQYYMKGKGIHHRRRAIANNSTGVAYQLTEDDPLINTEQCQRDASLMAELGANAIRVYHVDPSGDHDGCMSAFADAGIYLLVDLDTFTTAIDATATVRLSSTIPEAFC